jgi:ribosomal protein L40E
MSDQPLKPTTPEPEDDNAPEVPRDLARAEETPAAVATIGDVPDLPENEILLADDYRTYLDEHAPNVEHTFHPSAFVCVRCGGRNLARGMVIDFGGDKFEAVRFAPRRVRLSWLNSLFNLRPYRALLPLGAVACRDCGAVLLEIDTHALRLAERTRDADE